jgi:hypothetical protein
MSVSPFATVAPVPEVSTCCVSLVGAGSAGTVSVGVAPNAPQTSIPTAVVMVLADAADDDAGCDELDVGWDLELQAVSITAGKHSWRPGRSPVERHHARQRGDRSFSRTAAGMAH